jgi:hypothetical protein
VVQAPAEGRCRPSAAAWVPIGRRQMCYSRGKRPVRLPKQVQGRLPLLQSKPLPPFPLIPAFPDPGPRCHPTPMPCPVLRAPAAGATAPEPQAAAAPLAVDAAGATSAAAAAPAGGGSGSSSSDCSSPAPPSFRRLLQNTGNAV